MSASKNNLLLNSNQQDACFKDKPEISFFKNIYHLKDPQHKRIIAIDHNEYGQYKIVEKNYPNVLRWYKLISKRSAVIKGYNVVGKFEKIPLT